MATNSQNGSATIYQFPARGRFATGMLNQPAKIIDRTVARVANIAFGSNWYHDEAIEAERSRKN